MKNPSTIFSRNQSLSQKINDMNNETKKEVNPLVKLAVAKHTDLFLNDKFSFLKFTNENEQTFTLGYLEGMNEAANMWQRKYDELKDLFDTLKKENCPTLFLQEENKN